MDNRRTNRGRFSSWYNQKKQRSRTSGRRRSFGDASTTNDPQYQHQPVIDAGEEDVAADHLDDNNNSMSHDTRGKTGRFGAVRWGRSQSTGRARHHQKEHQQHHQQVPVSVHATAQEVAQHHQYLNHNQQQLQNQSQDSNPHHYHHHRRRPIHVIDVLATPAAVILRDEYPAKLGAPINRESTTIPASARAASVAATPLSASTRTPSHHRHHVAVLSAAPRARAPAASRAAVASMPPPPNILRKQQQKQQQHSLVNNNTSNNTSGIANNLNSPTNKIALGIESSSSNNYKKLPRRQTHTTVIPPLASPRNPSLLDTLHKLPGTIASTSHLLQHAISGLDDTSHWGDESTIASTSLMPLQQQQSKKEPSPNSVILEEGMSKSPTSSTGSHGRDYFMISNDHLLLNRGSSKRNVVDMLPDHSKSSFGGISCSSARRRANNNMQQHQFGTKTSRNKIQLPGDYFRSYAFSDDPSASKPKIRRRDILAENRSLAGGGSSLYSSQSRNSACNVSVLSRSAFSVSTGGSLHASCTTRSTQGSINSTQSAPPNVWEVDRILDKTKRKRNFEANTDLYKFPPPLPPARSLPGGQCDSDLKNRFTETMAATFTTSRIPRGQSDWMDESKGVPNEVSISFRRLALRSQVRNLEDCLDESPRMALAEKKHPPAPPLHHSDGIRTVQLNVATPTSSSNGIMISRKSSIKKVEGCHGQQDVRARKRQSEGH